jgi:hypothetical protein
VGKGCASTSSPIHPDREEITLIGVFAGRSIGLDKIEERLGMIPSNHFAARFE